MSQVCWKNSWTIDQRNKPRSKFVQFDETAQIFTCRETAEYLERQISYSMQFL